MWPQQPLANYDEQTENGVSVSVYFIWYRHTTKQMLFNIKATVASTHTGCGVFRKYILFFCSVSEQYSKLISSQCRKTTTLSNSKGPLHTWQLFHRYSRFQQTSLVWWQMNPWSIILQRSSFFKMFFPKQILRALSNSSCLWATRNHSDHKNHIASILKINQL